MTTNKITILVTISIILIIVGIPTSYKVIINHHKNLTNVTESKIIEASKRCFYEKKCLDNKITLKELYNNEYIEKVYNPITKEFYNDLSYVLKEDNNFKFVEVN